MPNNPVDGAAAAGGADVVAGAVPDSRGLAPNKPRPVAGAAVEDVTAGVIAAPNGEVEAATGALFPKRLPEGLAGRLSAMSYSE